MTKRWIGFFFFLLPLVSALAQTNRIASEFLDFFEEPSIGISRQILRLQSSVLLESSHEKTAGLKKETAAQVEKEKTRFREKKPFNGQEGLNQAFSKFLDAVALHLTYENQWIPASIDEFDSALVADQQQIYLERLDKLAKAGARLDVEIQNYCLLNRITGRKKRTGFYTLFSEAGKALRYGYAIQTVVLATRASERRFFTELAHDTGTLTSGIRIKVINQANQSTLKLKALAPYPGDFNLKTPALNSLRLYRMEATNDLPKFLVFKEKERDFIRFNRRMEESASTDELEKESFRKALKEYLGLIKETNDLAKLLDEQRLAHEQPFDLAFRGFIESKLEVEGR